MATYGKQHHNGDTTVEIDPLRHNVAAGGGANIIQLDAGASAVDNAYKSWEVRIRRGPGAGESARVAEYDGATKVATIEGVWDIEPTNASIFTISRHSDGVIGCADAKRAWVTTWCEVGTTSAVFKLWGRDVATQTWNPVPGFGVAGSLTVLTGALVSHPVDIDGLSMLVLQFKTRTAGDEVVSSWVALVTS